MSATSPAPAPLVVSASLAAVQGLVLLGYAALLLANVDTRHPVVAISTALIFVAIAVGLLACAWAVMRGNSWGRAPLVLGQLIALPIAWSFREEPTTLVAVVIALVAVVTVAGLLHPESVEHLADDPH